MSSFSVLKAELRHAIYTCGKRMRFQNKLGQTKVDFNNQSKSALQCIAFWLEIFLFKIEIACSKKLKWHVATSLKFRLIFFFDARKLAQKQLIKYWWNWPKVGFCIAKDRNFLMSKSWKEKVFFCSWKSLRADLLCQTWAV